MYIIKPLGLWSQTSLVSEFQLNRRTVAKRLKCLVVAFSKVRHRVLNLPDILQRDGALPAEALERCIEVTEQLLADLHDDLQQDEPETVEQETEHDMHQAV